MSLNSLGYKVPSVLYTRLDSRDWRPITDALPDALRRRAAKFVRAQDRDARIAAHWLLQTLLNKFDLDPELLNRIALSSRGRPFFPECPHFDFNLSHSGDYAVCGGILGGKIGVDVELVRPFDSAEADELFDAQTRGEIARAPDPVGEFFRAWTRLEAVAKAEGFGLGGLVRSIRFTGGCAVVGARHWQLLEIPLHSGYVCHAASSEPIGLENVLEM